MSASPDTGSGPRPLSTREREWCAWLLPEDRPAYREVAALVRSLVVIGEGRWGRGDYMLGREGDAVDVTAPMKPVLASGEVRFDDGSSVTLSIHQPDEMGLVELHIAGLDASVYERAVESSRWCYSYWEPGDPSPSTGASTREIALDASAEVILVIDGDARVLWMHDRATRGNVMVPVTNFYNELMLLKGIRDPQIALDHRLLFVDGAAGHSDAELADAFRRYNATWRKVDAERIAAAPIAVPSPHKGLMARIAGAMRGGSKR